MGGLCGMREHSIVLPGPRPDWDPEIVEALENAEVSSEPDQQLEDDFVLLVSHMTGRWWLLIVMS